MARVRRARVAKRRGSTAGKSAADRTGRRRAQAVPPEPCAGNGLGRREVEVLQSLAGGRSRKQIAAALFISPLTVHTHLKNIYVKLEAHNQIEALNAARSRGVIA